mgnify:CR=1 FL=1
MKNKKIPSPMRWYLKFMIMIVLKFKIQIYRIVSIVDHIHEKKDVGISADMSPSMTYHEAKRQVIFAFCSYLFSSRSIISTKKK